jgi:uronate dehydrogenase
VGRAEIHREHAMAEQEKIAADPVADFYQGGTFCAMEYNGDTSRMWS